MSINPLPTRSGFFVGAGNPTAHRARKKPTVRLAFSHMARPEGRAGASYEAPLRAPVSARRAATGRQSDGASGKKKANREVGFFIYGAPGRIRTSDPQVRSLVLYPTELRARGRSGIMVKLT